MRTMERKERIMSQFIMVFQNGYESVINFLKWMLGGFDGLLFSLFLFVIIGYITTLMLCILKNKIMEDLKLQGIFQRILVFLLVVVANFMDALIVNTGSALRAATIFFYIFQEAILILNNVVEMGIPIPEKLREAVEGLKNKKNNSKKSSGVDG